jgi:hypothetical protein
VGSGEKEACPDRRQVLFINFGLGVGPLAPIQVIAELGLPGVETAGRRTDSHAVSGDQLCPLCRSVGELTILGVLALQAPPEVTGRLPVAKSLTPDWRSCSIRFFDSNAAPKPRATMATIVPRVSLDDTPSGALPLMSAVVEIDTGGVPGALVTPVEAMSVVEGHQCC